MSAYVEGPSGNNPRPDHPAYRPDIDGLRAVAVLAVVWHHAFPDFLPGGFVGVDVFFVISGYLVGGIIQRAFALGNFSYADFYARRIRRILPSLCLVLIAVLIAGWFLLRADQYADLAKHAAAGTAFVANISLWQDISYFNWNARVVPLLHLWSLAVEEQFYIVWPILVACIYRFGAKALLATIILIGTLSFALNVMQVGADPSGTFYWAHTRAWELMAGCLLAWWGIRTPILPRGNQGAVLRNVAALSGALLILFPIVYYSSDIEFPGWRAALPVAGTALLIAAGPSALINRRVLANPVAVWFGLISYPLYLWHWPLLAFAQILEVNGSWPVRGVLVLVSVVLAWATFHWVESPIRQRRTVSPRTIFGGLVVIGLAALAINLTGGVPSREVASRPTNQFLQYYAQLHKTGIASQYRSECDFYDWESRRARPKIDKSCVAPGQSGTWMLWGDSHAQALSKGLRSILPAGVNLAQVATSGCNPSLSDTTKETPGNACNISNRFALQTIERLKPSVLLIAQREMHERTDWAAIADAAHKSGAGSIVVIGPVPQWLRSLPRIIVDRHWADNDNYIADDINKAVFATDRAMQGKGGIGASWSYISLTKALCQNDACLARLPSPGPYNLMAVDYGHLSPEGSLYVAKSQLAERLLSLDRGRN